MKNLKLKIEENEVKVNWLMHMFGQHSHSQSNNSSLTHALIATSPFANNYSN